MTIKLTHSLCHHNTHSAFLPSVMKEPTMSSVARLRKKPNTTITTAATATSRKLRLVCSFNGAFQLRPPPSNKLRYVGGETRIVSVDRNIGLSKLRSKIADLCPKMHSLSLKYQLSLAGSAHARNPNLDSWHDPDPDPPLVSVDSDDDVKCMIEEFDKLELYGKHVRLWLFVCGDSDDTNNTVRCDKNSYNDNGFVKRQGDGAQVCTDGFFYDVDDEKVVKNHVNDGGDDALRKTVLKQQQLLSKNLERTNGIDGVNKQNHDHPLVDLAPEPNNAGLCVLQGSGSYGNLGQYPVLCSHPLNLRDENSRSMGMNGSMTHCSSGQNVPENSDNFCNASVMPMCNGFDAKQDFGQGSLGYLNRENVMPWDLGCDMGALGSQWDGSVCAVKSRYGSERVWSGYQNGIRNHHRFVVNDARNQRIYPYQIRNHRNNSIIEMGNHRSTRLDGRLSIGKCYPGLRPISSISKPGLSMRSCCPNHYKPAFPENTMEGRTNVIGSGLNMDNSSFGISREQSGPAVSWYGNLKSGECHLAYHGIGAAMDKLIKNPSLPMQAIQNQQDLLTSYPYEKHDIPHQNVYKNYDEVHLNNDPFVLDQQRIIGIFDLSKNLGPSNGTTMECNDKLMETARGSNLLNNLNNGTHCLQGGVASSVDLLYNLSLSSSKGLEPPAPSSLASGDFGNALLKPEPKPLSILDKVQMNTGHKADKSNAVAANSSYQNSANMKKDQVHEEEIQQDTPYGLSIDEKAETKESIKCSKVIGGISNDLAAFYTHLATRELQTIKNSDLECIKELGSGTYGTVYYGKWKGSDVAIKRIKPSCFTKGLLEEDKLLADFWKEAHILGQLHHPNIVAFYGVVTDGPVNNLATVTEYMVNGSLKQVLRRKDRTIDRRKRLILAMDAAFGMEYLHEKNIVHFDLKSHNFLMNTRDPQRPVCKIGDLGLSKIKQRTLVSGGIRGTIPWMAPELLNTKNNMVTEKVDVYSFGIVMWELLTGEEPYANMRSEEIIAGIIKDTLRPEIPSWCDPAWRSLMERCWSSDPVSRPAFSEIAKELRTMSTAMNIR